MTRQNSGHVTGIKTLFFLGLKETDWSIYLDELKSGIQVVVYKIKSAFKCSFD